ncbi:MAG TPA: DPP IV N-terminal domain-containing protein [Candidatus Angelobacter sp.]
MPTLSWLRALKAGCAVACCLVFSTATAQQKTLTAGDYARAEKFMGYNANPLVLHNIQPAWLPDGRFWYRDTSADGDEFIVFDPAKQTREPAFDHEKVAASLSKSAGKSYSKAHLPFGRFEYSSDGKSILFAIAGKRWSCDSSGNSCMQLAVGERPDEVLSPDKKHAAFIRDYNLWIRDTNTRKETQLTTDGVKDYGYATNNAGWIHGDDPVLSWSPDSRKIATFQQDQRKVGEMYLVETKVGHPTLQAWKYPLPGDDVVTMIERVIIDLDTRKVIRLKMPPDQHRTTLCDDLKCRNWADVQWSPDASHLVFVSSSRDHKQATMRVANASTGEVRDVLEEKVTTQYESGWRRANWYYLASSNEVIWFSERSNWGHLYLYDFSTGKLKHAITSGDWVVTELVRVDEKERVAYFLAAGKEPDQNPYFRHFYRVDLDGRNLKLLSPEDGDHTIELAPSGKFFTDSYSRPDVPPLIVLRDSSGKLLSTIAKADISRLLAAGWQPPVPFSVKGRDGVTDIYGLMYKPANLDPAGKYPIVNRIYPGPQGGSVSNWGFSAARGDSQSLAELGFVVVLIEGMGNPLRSKKFHDAYFGNMGDNTLPDQVAGMKELAQRFPWIDMERVGIWGHSGGGYAAADAMFRYPDFFKVGISESGNHDNREYEDDWGERYQGLLTRNSDGTSNYDDQANQNFARSLKGHLLLMHGTMDDNVPPYNTLLVVNELIKANKDFDLLLLPNRRHGYDSDPYVTRRRWDYFVRYLMGAEPPQGYELKPPGRTAPGAGGPADADEDE